MENSKTLMKLMYKKENVHYKRMIDLFHEMNDFGEKFISYPIIVILVSFFHYCFAIMHFLFELYLSIFNKIQFKQNMEVSHKKVEATLQKMKTKILCNV